MKAGKITSLVTPSHSIADGLRTAAPGKLTFPVVKRHLDRVVLVSEEEIKVLLTSPVANESVALLLMNSFVLCGPNESKQNAMRILWERCKIVVEPSGAVAVAAILGEEFRALE